MPTLPLVRAKGCAAAIALLVLSACSTTPKTAVLPPVPTPPSTTANAVTTPPAPSSATLSPGTATPPSAVTTPTTPAPTGPTALPPVTAPTGPTLTASQAYAMVRRAYDAANIAFRTGDTTAYRAAVGKGCRCLTLVQFMDGLAKKHEKLTGGLFVNVRVQDFMFDKIGSQVSAFYTGSVGRITDAHGRITGTVAARSESQDAVTLQYDGRAWYVANISNLTPGRELP